MRKGGEEEARSVRAVCDACAEHSDRAAVGVDVDTKGISLREDETHFPLNVKVECRAFVSDRILVGLRCQCLALRKGDRIPRFPGEP